MIYLDSAATTLQKPPEVAAVVREAVNAMASPGRGGYRAAELASDAVFQCRKAAADLFGLDNPEQVVFTLNATHALNLAIRSLIQPGDTVVVSGYEHNAVTRPLTALRAKLLVAESALFRPDEFMENLERLLNEARPAAVVCTYVSNVFGYIMPIREAAILCRERGIPLIVDASQAAGTLPLKMTEWGITFAGMPGHKGLYGPQGTGILLCGTDKVRPLLYGGTGSASLRQDMPDFLPDRLEAGTQNVAGISGLLAGINYVARRGERQILLHEQRLMRRAAGLLQGNQYVRVFYDGEDACQSGVLSFCIRDMDCEEVGEALGMRGIAVRSGLHCAPFAHRSSGTLECGTVRASFSAFNTAREVEALAAAINEIR